MAKSDKDRQIIIMRRKGSALCPLNAFDAEIIEGFAADQDIEVTFRQRRSNPQLRRYWVMLAEVVAATECHPNADKLHEALKFDMGYTAKIKRLNGVIITVADSVAFSRMGAAEFKGFFDRAVRLISEAYGIDPLALEDKAA
jgi:hypothetical protein